MIIKIVHNNLGQCASYLDVVKRTEPVFLGAGSIVMCCCNQIYKLDYDDEWHELSPEELNEVHKDYDG